MVTKEELANKHGAGVLFHMTKTDAIDNPMQARLNGKIQTWVTRPTEFRQPMKYGLFTYFDITHETAHQWKLME